MSSLTQMLLQGRDHVPRRKLPKKTSSSLVTPIRQLQSIIYPCTTYGNDRHEAFRRYFFCHGRDMFNSEVCLQLSLQRTGKYKCTAEHKDPEHLMQKLQSSFLPSKPVPQANADSLRVETVVDDDNSGNDESLFVQKTRIWLDYCDDNHSIHS
jgi:hypothetical protein